VRSLVEKLKINVKMHGEHDVKLVTFNQTVELTTFHQTVELITFYQTVELITFHQTVELVTFHQTVELVTFNRTLELVEAPENRLSFIREIPNCVSAVFGVYHAFQSSVLITFGLGYYRFLPSILAIPLHNLPL
jgi:hypothetical protein